MGGGGRKPRNSATFRLFPRAGAADPNERVFVRVDNNDYSVPGFADEDAFDSDLTADPTDLHSSASGPLPEHVRRQILELGLPDDGYNYLSHLRELRPSAGAASSFVPSSTAHPEPLPLDIKAYDASRVRVAPSADDLDEGRTMCKVAAKTAPLRGVQRAVDPDVARLLDESDASHGGSEDEGLEEDFVIMANQTEGDDEVEEEEEEFGSGVLSDVEEEEEFEDEPKPRMRGLLDEQFDLLALEEYGDSDDEDDRGGRDEDYELPSEAIAELKLFHDQNGCVDEEYRTPADFVRGKLESTTVDEVDESANVIRKCAEYAERYLNEPAEEKEVVLVSESSDESEVWDCETIVSTYSNLDNHPGKIETPGNPRKRLPRVFPGETSTTNDLIKLHGKEKLPVDYLPQRKRNGEKEKKVKPAEDLSTEKHKKEVHKETKEEKKARKAAVKEGKREARKTKKELKGLYKSETHKAQKVAAVMSLDAIEAKRVHGYLMTGSSFAMLVVFVDKRPQLLPLYSHVDLEFCISLMLSLYGHCNSSTAELTGEE